MNEGPLNRARLLREQGRPSDASDILVGILQENPDSDSVLAELALCEMSIQGKESKALESVRKAISLEPNYAFYHGIEALILLELRQDKSAIVSAEKAIAMDPVLTLGYVALSQCYARLNQWKKVEIFSRKALEIDPDLTGARNLLLIALRNQNKNEEHDHHLSGLLSEDPEDSFTHSNAGWSALQRGDDKQAEIHFRESLRLNPNSEHARDGLLNSFKSRSKVYSLYLKYCFFMQRFSAAGQWAIIIGLFIGVRIGREILNNFHPLAAVALGVAYLLFALWVWVASGIGNFIVLLDKNARFALKKCEVWDGIFVGGAIITGILCAIVGVFHHSLWLTVSILLAASCIPASMLFVNNSKKGKYLFGSLFAYLYSVLIAIIVATFTGNESFINSVSAMMQLGLFGAFISTWLGGIQSLNQRA